MRIPFAGGFSIGTDIVACKRIFDHTAPNAHRLDGFLRRMLRKDEFLELKQRFVPENRADGIQQNIGRPRFSWAQRAAGLDEPHRERLAHYLGGRWAAKEAAKKAWGASLVSFRDLKVNYSQEGKAIILLNPFKENDTDQVEQEAILSISHDGGFAVATVIAMPLDPKIMVELERQRRAAAIKIRKTLI